MEISPGGAFRTEATRFKADSTATFLGYWEQEYMSTVLLQSSYHGGLSTQNHDIESQSSALSRTMERAHVALSTVETKA